MLPIIYLVRHGETEWSRSGRHTSRTDLPLSAHGEEAARALGQRLRGIPFARVLSSPRVRARRTCELALPEVTAEIEPDLAEWDYGDDEGLRSTEILAARPGWTLFRDGCPRGETPAQISARADRVIARLRPQEGNVALFSHGHFGRVLGARWIGLDVEQARHFLLGTASLCLLGYEHERHDEPVIAAWNATVPLPLGSAPAAQSADNGPLKRSTIERWENEGGEIPAAPGIQTAR